MSGQGPPGEGRKAGLCSRGVDPGTDLDNHVMLTSCLAYNCDPEFQSQGTDTQGHSEIATRFLY